jgi:peptide methionine sulfoxide reductase MsrA
LIIIDHESEKNVVSEVIEEVNRLSRFENPIITQVSLGEKFYDAEEYHQDYLVKNPMGYTCPFIRK